MGVDGAVVREGLCTLYSESLDDCGGERATWVLRGWQGCA